MDEAFITGGVLIAIPILLSTIVFINWKYSKIGIGYVKFFSYSLDRRMKILSPKDPGAELYDHPDIVRTRMQCYVVIGLIMLTGLLLRWW